MYFSRWSDRGKSYRCNICLWSSIIKYPCRRTWYKCFRREWTWGKLMCRCVASQWKYCQDNPLVLIFTRDSCYCAFETYSLFWIVQCIEAADFCLANLATVPSTLCHFCAHFSVTRINLLFIKRDSFMPS